jgi:hypothetical protein
MAQLKAIVPSVPPVEIVAVMVDPGPKDGVTVPAPVPTFVTVPAVPWP